MRSHAALALAASRFVPGGLGRAVDGASLAESARSMSRVSDRGGDALARSGIALYYGADRTILEGL